MEKRNNTSWSGVAKWYEKLLSGEGTYQKEVILPNLLRLMDIKRGEKVLDLACGPGFFSKEFVRAGAKVLGVDISSELIAVAKESVKDGEFVVSNAEELPFIKNGSMDKVAIVLALQNIEHADKVIKECARVLKTGGALHLVLNHPAFRNPGTHLVNKSQASFGRFRLQTAHPSSKDSMSIPSSGWSGFRPKTSRNNPAFIPGMGPKMTSWGWDPENKIQYRRVDEYLSESKSKIQMHPGDAPELYTVSFHRPLQFYFKIFSKLGFAVERLEEWNSNKKSEAGPCAKAEDKARKEIPLFLYMAIKKYGS